VVPIIILTLPATAGRRNGSPGEDVTATTAGRAALVPDPLQAAWSNSPAVIPPKIKQVKVTIQAAIF